MMIDYDKIIKQFRFDLELENFKYCEPVHQRNLLCFNYDFSFVFRHSVISSFFSFSGDL